MTRPKTEGSSLNWIEEMPLDELNPGNEAFLVGYNAP